MGIFFLLSLECSVYVDKISVIEGTGPIFHLTKVVWNFIRVDVSMLTFSLALTRGRQILFSFCFVFQTKTQFHYQLCNACLLATSFFLHDYVRVAQPVRKCYFLVLVWTIISKLLRLKLRAFRLFLGLCSRRHLSERKGISNHFSKASFICFGLIFVAS